ncbi:phage portal protein [Gordonia sp. NPDC003425]
MATQQNHNLKAIEQAAHRNRRDSITDRQQQRQQDRARLLARQTVASVYQVNPIQLGDLDKSNYANSREARQAFVRDSLGPLLSQMQSVFNRALRPWLKADEYVELNTQAKLAGSYEEQAAVLTSSVGGPYLTVNEARARLNLPAVEGGEQVLSPMNMQGTQQDRESEAVGDAVK